MQNKLEKWLFCRALNGCTFWGLSVLESQNCYPKKHDTEQIWICFLRSLCCLSWLPVGSYTRRTVKNKIKWCFKGNVWKPDTCRIGMVHFNQTGHSNNIPFIARHICLIIKLPTSLYRFIHKKAFKSTVKIRKLDQSGFRMVDLCPVVEWSGFQMPFWKSDPFVQFCEW
jgi:hypothetical protein